jgi:hypothetical protein
VKCFGSSRRDVDSDDETIDSDVGHVEEAIVVSESVGLIETRRRPYRARRVRPALRVRGRSTTADEDAERACCTHSSDKTATRISNVKSAIGCEGKSCRCGQRHVCGCFEETRNRRSGAFGTHNSYGPVECIGDVQCVCQRVKSQTHGVLKTG